MEPKEKARMRSMLRRLWMWSGVRREALAKARVSRGVYLCGTCAGMFGPKEVDVDHIVQATPEGGLHNVNDWVEFFKRLLFCGLDGLVVLCKPCHKIKTAEERAKRTIKKKTRRKKLRGLANGKTKRQSRCRN